MYEDDDRIQLALVTPESIAPCFAPRPRDSNKGKFGHVLVVAGSRAKPGAAAMAGLAALRAGAGLVTVACPESAVGSIASHSAELMMEPLAETESGEIARAAFDRIAELAAKRTLIAIGPGIGTNGETREVVLRLFAEAPQPMVVDADALNCLAESVWEGKGALRVLTPHPGEMSRLTGRTIAEIQADRIAAARALATSRKVVVVLKGERTLIGFPDGRVWINPTGSPAMAKGGTGDILTGMVSGLMGQFPRRSRSRDCGRGLSAFAGRRNGRAASNGADRDRHRPAAISCRGHSWNHEHSTRTLKKRPSRSAVNSPVSLQDGVVLLIGNLGAGKTTLAKGIVQGRNGTAPDEVSSPTFTLIHQYGEAKPRFITSIFIVWMRRGQVESLGLDELFAGGSLVLLEWAERFPALLPRPRTEIRLRALADETREIGVSRVG